MTISSCTISGNSAYYVRARSSSKVPNAPMGRMLKCFCLDSRLRNCGQRSCQLQPVRAAETFKTSHRPDGKLTFCSLFAGRRCLRRRWLSDHLIVHHQREFSWRCARAHALKSSVLGALLTCPNGLSLFNSDRSSVLPGSSTCQPRLQTSHRADGKIADMLALTHACTIANDSSVKYRMYVPQRR